MDRRLRDAALAATVAAGLLAAALALGVEPTELLDPVAAAVGVAGALALELPFLLFPERAHRLWYRPVVQVGAAALALVGGVALLVAAGTWVVTAVLAGLCTYFVLLAVSFLGAPPVGTAER
ncbi:hypothetical protein ACFO0N_01920 [Halobium salinum]|uniref:Uncharacterized protein n=1 Tax=Halobium salinum TaxID=1364940 RepID=A0ABD5P776_9EURY|nr:hypothetical protein [Halobium salinum]